MFSRRRSGRPGCIDRQVANAQYYAARLRNLSAASPVRPANLPGRRLKPGFGNASQTRAHRKRNLPASVPASYPPPRWNAGPSKSLPARAFFLHQSSSERSSLFASERRSANSAAGWRVVNNHGNERAGQRRNFSALADVGRPAAAPWSRGAEPGAGRSRRATRGRRQRRITIGFNLIMDRYTGKK